MASYSDDQYFYASIPLPEQPHSPLPHATPSFAQRLKPDGLSAALLTAQEHASRKRIVGTTCLLTALIFISLISMNAVLLSYICIIHQCQLSSLSIVSTAPLGKVLTISQVTSHVAPVSVPIIMGLLSYLLAAKWLRSSLDGGPNRPTPNQLGLLMSICNGASLASLFSSLKYIFKQPTANGERSARPPPILRHSIFVLGSLLAVTYVAAAADSWLHATGKSIVISSNSDFNLPINPNFGRAINTTICQLATTNEAPNDIGASSCGLISSGSGGSGNTLAEGIRVVSNTSNLHRVVFADDQTAILVPQSVPSNTTYIAQTLGVKTHCKTITKECIQPTLFEGTLDYGPDARLNLNCSNAGIKYVNGTDVIPLCALDDQGVCVTGYRISTNPFTSGEVAISQAYLSPGQEGDAFIGNTGWFVHGNNGAWNVLFCNITALSVTYTYASSLYILRSATPKPLTEARYMMAAGLDGPTTVVSYAVDGAGLQTNATYEQAYALEVSRQMLARGAFIYEATGVIQINAENDVTGSSLQVVPLALFVVALLVFAFQILYISLRTLMAARGVQYVGLAAQHLSDPLAAVQKLYGHPDPVLTWETEQAKKFGREGEEDRLRVGPVLLSDSGDQRSVFIVTKG